MTVESAAGVRGDWGSSRPRPRLTQPNYTPRVDRHRSVTYPSPIMKYDYESDGMVPMDESGDRGYRTERGTVGGFAVISTGNHRATTAGLGVLMHGGNAFDAAVAAGAVLAVVEPITSHLGGDVFALLKPAGGDVRAINASGPAPMLPDAGELLAGRE